MRSGWFSLVRFDQWKQKYIDLREIALKSMNQLFLLHVIFRLADWLSHHLIHQLLIKFQSIWFSEMSQLPSWSKGGSPWEQIDWVFRSEVRRGRAHLSLALCVSWRWGCFSSPSPARTRPSDSGPVCHAPSSTALPAASEPCPPAACSHLQSSTAHMYVQQRSRMEAFIKQPVWRETQGDISTLLMSLLQSQGKGKL